MFTNIILYSLLNRDRENAAQLLSFQYKVAATSRDYGHQNNLSEELPLDRGK